MNAAMRREILSRFLAGESVGYMKAFGIKAAEGAIVTADDIEGVIRDNLRWHMYGEPLPGPADAG